MLPTVSTREGPAKLGPGVTEEHVREWERLYDLYARQLEADHWGKFVAITPDGKTLLASTLTECVHRADEQFGPRSCVYKIGPREVGRIR
jgi:hypothetical protein